jgi:hypothetical protein
MKPPKSIKILTIIITTLSILSGTLHNIFPSLISFPNLTPLLSIQLNSISNFTFFQFITHMLFYPAFSGLHIFYFINIFFGLMILHRVGSVIIYHKGEKKFLTLFLISGITSGVAAYLTIAHFGSLHLYAGPTAALYSLLIATVFLFPKLDLLLFFASSMKGKYAVPALIGMMLLMNLSAGDYVHFFATLTASITSYLYIVLFWKMKSPYECMKTIDQALINLSYGKIFLLFRTTKLEKYTGATNIYDIRTGKAVLNEESFINACLEKISKEGRKSLTLYERFRLYRYGKRNQLTK